MNPTRTTQQTIAKFRIDWLPDNYTRIRDYDVQAVFYDCSRALDVQATYEKLISVGGCTPEQSRQQTAELLHAVKKFCSDKWSFVGCTLTIYLDSAKTLELPGSLSVWGIESFLPETAYLMYEQARISEAIRELKSSLGFEGDWDSVEREVHDRPNDKNPFEGVKPLEALPEPNEFFDFRYASARNAYYPAGTAMAICNECGNVWTLDAKEIEHDEGCINDMDGHCRPSLR